MKYQLEAGLFILYPKHYINYKKAEIVSVGGRILFMCIVKIYQGKVYTQVWNLKDSCSLITDVYRGM